MKSVTSIESMDAVFAALFGKNTPIQIQTLPIQRTGVQDGTSGLQYSGRLYTNQFQQHGADICKGARVDFKNVGDVLPNSISTTNLPVDATTNRISAANIQSYVKSLVDQKIIPDSVSNFEQQLALDSAFYESVQREYCFYETRYKAALTQFLELVSDVHIINL